MRVGLITAHYPPSSIPCGVGDYTARLRGAFETLGHSAAVLTSRSSAAGPGVFPLAATWGLGDLVRCLRTLRELKPDVLFLQYTPEHYGYGPLFKLLPLCLRRRNPATVAVTTFHTLVGGRWVSKPYAALLAATSHGVISTNDELTDLYRRRLGPWTGKLCEIPIGPNIERSDLSRREAAARLRARLGLAKDLPIVGCFGFPAEGKGMDTLHESLALAAATPFHLLFVARIRDEDRPARAALARLARERKIETHVSWLEGLPSRDAARALAGCDVYAVPYEDGVSLRRGTLMAGWQQGLAVISTTPRFPSPHFLDGETLLLVPPRDPPALLHAIRRLLTDPNVRERLEQAALRQREAFAWPGIAAAHLDFARALGAGGGR